MGIFLWFQSPLIQESVQTIPGTDGRKMSKNYQNVIPLFASKKDRKKAVMQIATDSSSLEDPKDPESCTVFALYSLFATDVQINEMRSAYLAGGYGFGHAKLALLDVLEETFYPMQERYDALMKEPEIITQALDAGAKKAKELLNKKMASVRKAVGLARLFFNKVKFGSSCNFVADHFL